VHEPALAGAWYSPVPAIEPHDAAHVDGTLDVNCCCVPAGNVGLRGVMVSEVDGAAIESNPYAVYFVVPLAMASMVQFVPTVPLAVNRPVALIVPHFAVQVTGMLAVNCCVCPCGVLADTGVITMADTTVMPALALLLEFVAVTLHVVLG